MADVEAAHDGAVPARLASPPPRGARGACPPAPAAGRDDARRPPRRAARPPGQGDASRSRSAASWASGSGRRSGTSSSTRCPTGIVQVLGPGDAFVIALRISVVTGIILAMPVILWQIWAFVSPGLTAAEQRTVRPWIPLALRVLRPRRGAGVHRSCRSRSASCSRSPTIGWSRNLAAGPYFDFVTTMFLAFGLVLEFPIVLYGLSRVGIVTSERLAASRRIALLAIVVFAAGITPGGDLVSPLALGGTMYLLYEGTIFFIRRSGQVTARGGAMTRDDDRPPAGIAAASPTDAAAARPDDQQVVVLTGLSGGGKTAAAKLFEDLGYVVVDNLPGELLRDLADLIATEPVRYGRTAIVLDVRTGDVPLAFGAMRGALEGRGIRPVIIFLEARDDVLIRRFSRDPPSPPAGRRAGDRRVHRPRAGDAGLRPRPGRRRARHQRPVAARAARADLRAPRRRPRVGSPVDPAHQLRLQVRRAARGGPGAGRPVHEEPPLHRGAAARSRASRPRCASTCSRSRSPTPSSAHLQGLLDLLVPAYVEEGKTRLTDRHRLHRRLAPLRRHVARSSPPGCASGTSGPSPSSTGSSSGEPAPLADRRHRRQAVAPRSRSSASSCSPSASPTSSARSWPARSPAARSCRSSTC